MMSPEERVKQIVEAVGLLPDRARFELLQNGIQGVQLYDSVDRPRVGRWFACWADVVLGMADAPADLLEATASLTKQERGALLIAHDHVQKQAEAHPGGQRRACRATPRQERRTARKHSSGQTPGRIRQHRNHENPVFVPTQNT